MFPHHPVGYRHDCGWAYREEPDLDGFGPSRDARRLCTARFLLLFLLTSTLREHRHTGYATQRIGRGLLELDINAVFIRIIGDGIAPCRSLHKDFK
jgi:hypothetical protein